MLATIKPGGQSMGAMERKNRAGIACYGHVYTR